MADRNAVYATILCTLILVAYFAYFRPAVVPPPPVASADTLSAEAPTPELRADSVVVADTSLGVGATRGTARAITVETDLYTAVLSTQGASLRAFRLKEYQKSDRRTPVDLVDAAAAPEGALGLSFTTPRSRNVDTRSLFFTTPVNEPSLRVTGDSLVVPFEANLGDGVLRMAYVFKKGEYEVGLRIDRQNAAAFSTGGYDVLWSGAVPFTEEPVERPQEVQRSGAYARSGGSVENVTLAQAATGDKTLGGAVDWVATKGKYFTAVVIPSRRTESAEISGERQGDADDPNVRETYNLRLEMPTLAEGQTDRFRLYLGPMEYLRLAKYDLDLYDMVDFGWDWMEAATRPIAKFVFIPVFAFLGAFLPNYGLVIMVFALLIKLVTHPMTRAQAKSMIKMRAVQPRMEAIKEKYADDPAKQQEATMRLYKDAGVNPLGGCLPMLLQYPILIALWQYLPQSMNIRQQPFLWASDLSAPDPILHLPFTIPFYGDFVAGFTLLMGLSLVVQMKIQARNQPTNPQMQVLTYMMPVMLFLFFNKQASGLSLYYLCYNILSAAEQWWVRKTTPEMTFAADEHAAPAEPSKPRSTPPARKLAAQAAAADALPRGNGRKK